MLSVPIFARQPRQGENAIDVPVRGTLSVDTSTPLNETGWIDESADDTISVTKRVNEIAIQWAAVITKLLT